MTTHPVSVGDAQGKNATFNTAGKYPYHCSIHGASGGGGMSGVIEVRGRP